MRSDKDVPSDVGAWLKNDIENISRWYYHVETLKRPTDKAFNIRLDELGKERWECFQVIRDKKTWRVFCKRRKRSYLRMVPVNQLLEMGSDGGN